MSERRRKRKRSYTGLILLLMIIVLIGGGAFAIIHHIMNQEGYHNEKSFNKYVEDYYGTFPSEHAVGEENSSIEFGEPVSTAVEYPTMSDDMENSAIDEVIKGKKDDFEVKYKGLTDEEKAALLIGYEAHKTDEKVESVAIHEKQVLNAGEENQEVPVDTVSTFNFSTKNGVAMTPSHFFKGGWQDIAMDAVKEAASDDYKDKLDDVDLTKFVFTGSAEEGTFTFWFDAGVIAPAEEGAKSVEVKASAFKDVIKDKLGENVIDPNKPMVAITYDDGPGEGTTAQILDILEENNAVATFFELGANVKNVEGAADLLKREVELGCEVGTHSWDHPNLFTLSDSQLKSQAEKSKAAIKDAIGQEPTVFRAPYGNGNDKIAKIFGLPGINWSVDTLDWSSKNAASVISVVKSYKGHLDGQVILMHSIYQSTVDASKELVPWLKSQGYQLVTVSDLLRYKYNTEPQALYYGYTFMELDGGHNAGMQ
ncbi:MAG: polysaccharide deacetylase family protein [Firmicutes bacterium]|nr:polysaccharide deacetylase family protein [Bacillota bacterium]